MKKRKGRLPLIFGSVLILAGLCLFLIFQLSSCRGDRQSRSVLAKINALLPERTVGVPELSADPGMPVLEIDGTDYVALVEIPAYDIALPVADQWDSQSLTTGPVRFHGSAWDNSLVIGGADRVGQFSFCSEIDTGAVVTVTDMTGAQFSYRVTRVDRSDSAPAQWLIRDDSDLTLYCRDSNSMAYIAVRCALNGANDPQL